MDIKKQSSYSTTYQTVEAQFAAERAENAGQTTSATEGKSRTPLKAIVSRLGMIAEPLHAIHDIPELAFSADDPRDASLLGEDQEPGFLSQRSPRIRTQLLVHTPATALSTPATALR